MSTWVNQLKNPIDFLALESAILDLLLLETGDQIILEQTGIATSLWVNVDKN